jgi:ribosome-binding factor A
MTTRTERVSDLIRAEVARLIGVELRDPRLGFVTVTGAEITADLRSVRVFVSVLGDENARRVSLQALNRAAGFFRRTLFRNLRLRHAPAVAFVFDDSLDRGDRIDRALASLHAGERPADEEE